MEIHKTIWFGNKNGLDLHTGCKETEQS